MIREVFTGCETIRYNMQCKNVKNINIRIKSDGTVHVSAHKLVPQRVIDEFVLSKADYILSAIDKYKSLASRQIVQYYTEEQLREVIHELCRKVYPYFEGRGIRYPQIRFRRMVSRWGSCHSSRGIVTFNTNLMYAPIECIEYVVLHEFTHFLQANHSDRFYGELAKVCPDWKKLRKRLKEINIP